MTHAVPAEQDAIDIAQNYLGTAVQTIERFPTGLGNYVYDIVTATGQRVVVRMRRIDGGTGFAGALYWYGLLVPLGVPLPAPIHAVAQPQDGAFPFMIVERLPGRDLQYEYPALSSNQKHALARRLVQIQNAVGELPPGPGYGFARSYTDGSLHPSWVDVLQAELERSRQRIQEAGVAPVQHVDRVAGKLPEYMRYLAAVKPRCFLDDTTTKNVIVHEGRLSGIVDVDWVCFGDPLLTVALTQMSLLNNAYDTDYITYWTDELDLDAEQHAILTLYTAIFCVGFLGELGQNFNKDTAISTDPARIDHLVAILDSLMARI